MRKRNWKKYNKALVQRGSLTFLIHQKSLKTTASKRMKSKGRPQEFSHGLIEVLLLKIHFKMPNRMLEEFTRYALEHMKNISDPKYSLVCKRTKNLTYLLPKLSSRRPSTVIIDSTGIKVCGEGEWKRKIHGNNGSRKRIKLHVIIDDKTQEIVSVVSTSSSVRPLIGFGAYDHHWIRALMKKRGGRVLVPPPKNGVFRGKGLDRDQEL